MANFLKFITPKYNIYTVLCIMSCSTTIDKIIILFPFITTSKNCY